MLLLLSAMMTALLGAGPGFRAVARDMHQVVAVADVVGDRTARVSCAERPANIAAHGYVSRLVALPPEPSRAVPLYRDRLRV